MKNDLIDLKKNKLNGYNNYRKLKEKGFYKMKTSEFIKRVEELGYKWEEKEDFSTLDIYDRGTNIISISTIVARLYILNYEHFDSISEELFSLMIDYTMTPIEEREVMYYLKSKIPKMGMNCYLNWVADEDRLTFLDKSSTPNFSSYSTKSKWEKRMGCTWKELTQWLEAEPYKGENK